jgi:hypothetical protein
MVIRSPSVILVKQAATREQHDAAADAVRRGDYHPKSREADGVDPARCARQVVEHADTLRPVSTLRTHKPVS